MMSQAKCLTWQTTFPVAVLYPAHVPSPYKSNERSTERQGPIDEWHVCTENSAGAAATQASREPVLLSKLVASENPLHSSTV